MSSFEFICGGDHGAWECCVDVELTDAEASCVKEYSKSNDNLFNDGTVASVYNKVYKALIDQCVSAYHEAEEMDDIRDEYATSEEESDESVVRSVLDSQGFVITIPNSLRNE